MNPTWANVGVILEFPKWHNQVIARPYVPRLVVIAYKQTVDEARIERLSVVVFVWHVLNKREKGNQSRFGMEAVALKVRTIAVHGLHVVRLAPVDTSVPTPCVCATALNQSTTPAIFYKSYLAFG